MSWAKFYTYTPDPTKAGTIDQSNFPVLVKVTHNDLRTIPNGGLVTDGTKDIAFYSDAGGITLLKFERVFYDAVAGTIWAWVKQATLSHTAGIPFYMLYGNPAIVSDLSDPTNVWDANFKAVYHFGDGTTLSVADSTSNANTLTNVAVATPGTGPAGGAVTLNGTTQYLHKLTAPVTAWPLTISALFNPTAAADAAIVSLCTQSAANVVGEMTQRNASQFVRASNGAANAATSTAYSTAAWNHATARFVTTTSRFIHLNGAAGVQNVTSIAFVAPDDISIGDRFANSVHNNFFGGSVGEVRISNIDRGADYAIAEYNSLTSPSTFAVESGPSVFVITASITTQPSTSLTSGGTFAQKPVVTLSDNTFTGNVVATLATGSGSLTNATVAAVAGVATFTNLTVTGDGGSYTLTFTPAGVSPVTSNAFSVIGANTAAAQAAIAAMGSNATVPFFYEYRLNTTAVAGGVTAWDDAVGTLGGRTPGIQLAQAGAAGLRGTLGTGITFASASSQCLVSGQDARLAFDAVTPLYLFICAKATGNGPVAGIVSNPTSATAYPFGLIQPAAGNWKANVAATGAGDTFAPDTGTAIDSNIRVLGMGKTTHYVGPSAQGTGNEEWMLLNAGRQQQTFTVVPVATTVAGGDKLTVGRLGPLYADATIYAMCVYSGTAPKTAFNAWNAYCIAQFGAVPDTSKTRTLLFHCPSLGTGFLGADELTYVIGTGTGSPPYLASRLNTGPGTWLARGLDVLDPHSFIHGVNGRDLQQMIDLFPLEVLPLIDTYRGSLGAIVQWEISNAILKYSWTGAQALAKTAEYTALVRAQGLPCPLVTCIDRTTWYTPFSTGALNANGQAVLDWHTGVRGSAAGGTYHDGLIDIALDNAFVTNRAGSHACTDLTYFNADGGHCSPTGYTLMAPYIKNFFDNNPTILNLTVDDSGDSGTMMRMMRSRRRAV